MMGIDRRSSLAGQRLTSLDAFRGLTIVGMILVNNPGSSKFVYPPLRHAEWNGWTFGDLVFPFFIFILGVSISFALTKRKREGARSFELYFKIITRSLVIFGLGLFLHLIPRFDFITLRIPGVLQRIALCYFFAALIYLNSGTKGRGAISFLLITGYWLLLKFVPVPGYGAGILDYQGNLCGYIDTQLLTGHLYKPEFDPEGILSTLPAVATALFGTLAGDWLRSSKKDLLKAAGLFSAGSVLVFAGLKLHPLFPINKQLWTSTFVLFTAGVAALVLMGCFLLIEGLGLKKWAIPFIVFGMNAIAVYVGSILLNKLLREISVEAGGEKISLLTAIYQTVFVPWAGKWNGSLFYAMVYVLFWLVIMFPLYKKKIYIKI